MFWAFAYMMLRWACRAASWSWPVAYRGCAEQEKSCDPFFRAHLPGRVNAERLHRMMLGFLSEFGDIGPTCDAGGGSEPSSNPITESAAIRTISA